MTELTQSDIKQALSKVTHPEINYSLVDLGMIKDVVCEERKISLTLKLPFPQIPIKNILIQSIKQTLADLDSSIKVEINTEQMNQEQCDNFMKMAKEGWKF
jgi:metal-sulfur cluster biosynthetic enzyme